MSKRPTILDVAARAGVGKSSVSRVLAGSPLASERTRRAVERAIAELGYSPNGAARTLVSRRSQSIGVLVTDLHNPFFPDILDGVDAVAAEHDYTPLVVDGKGRRESEEAALHRLVELRVDGIVCVAAHLRRRTLVEVAAAVPVVMLTRTPQAPRVDAIFNDDVAGAAMVVRYLAGLGHRRIGMAADAQERAGPARIKGYRSAMEELGLGDEVAVVPGGFTEAGGYEAGKALLARGVTAVFAANDLGALGVLDAAAELGFPVPAALSVVGYDNVSTAELRFVSLTSVDQASREIGAAATRALLARIDRPALPARRLVVPPVLVPRRTTAPPPA